MNSEHKTRNVAIDPDTGDWLWAADRQRRSGAPFAEAAANLARGRVWQGPVRSAAADDCATQGRHLEPEQSAAAGADGFWRWLDRQSGSVAHAARPLS